MFEWLKALHLIFMVTWFCGIFYLPRLFVYHAMSNDQISIDRFKIMERKLYFGIATPGALLTFIFGFWMVILGLDYYRTAVWFHMKFSLILLLLGYHILCGYYLAKFKKDSNKHSHVFYRWFNEIPVLFLILIVLLAVFKPFS